MGAKTNRSPDYPISQIQLIWACPPPKVGGRAIRHSLHSAIATLRSNNTSYPSRKKRITNKRATNTRINEPRITKAQIITLFLRKI